MTLDPDATTRDREAFDAERTERARLARLVKLGKRLPAAGDLFGEPSPLTATPPPAPLDLFGGSE